ncbi:MAG: hypothetical protein V4620_01690 [Bacteroidota bacterium]
MELTEYAIAIKNYKMKITKDFRIAAKITPLEFKVLNFNTKELKDRSLFETRINKNQVENGNTYLYYFKIVDSFNHQDLKIKISRFKETHRKGMANYLALPKVNESTLDKYLYVGKSEDGFLSRLRIHFGFTSNGTYGLHILKWFEYCGISDHFQIELHFAEVKLNNEQNHLLEIMESALHHELKPILGRSGH